MPFGESLIFNILNYDIIIRKKKNLLFLVILKKKLMNFFLKMSTCIYLW